MKIIVTGASGFVGRQLVPELQLFGHELLLVGRNSRKLSLQFPDYKVCDYSQIEAEGKDFDYMIHLAVLNNDFVGNRADFYDVNVDFLVKTALVAKKAGVRNFLNFSTFHIFTQKKLSDYARSKLEGEKALRSISGFTTHTIYLPLIYGKYWSGRLKFLNSFPKPLANLIFSPLSALKPTLAIKNLAEYVNIAISREVAEIKFVADDQDKNRTFFLTKRLVDLTFAISVVLLLPWLLFIIFLVILIDSFGAPIFVQPRVGQNGKVFNCYKFRTMKLGTKHVGTHEITSNSVTRVGSFLRKTKLDELPQIINIFRNELSLVGPRPCLTSQKTLLEHRKKLDILSVKPGITGWAQIKNIDMSDPKKLSEVDSEYLAFRSIILDLRIILKTAFGGGQGDKTGN